MSGVLVCPGCGASVDVAADHLTATCVFCATPGAVTPASSFVPPALMVPFTVSQAAARDAVKRWQRSRSFFADRAIESAVVEGRLRGVYAPAWLYSAEARSHYEARVGEDYEEVVVDEDAISVQGERAGEPRAAPKKKRVTKTEWHTLRGEHVAAVADVVVSAGAGVSDEEFAGLDVDLRGLRRFDARALPGFAAARCSRDLSSGWNVARQKAKDSIAAELSTFLPGDRREVRSLTTSLVRESLDEILLPVWIVALRPAGRPPVRVLVDGTRGTVFGKAPWATVRVMPVVLAALVLAIAAFVWWQSR